MFDLFRSQAKAMRYLLIVLLSLVALSMVVTLIPGFGGGFATTNEQVLAEVGGQPVTGTMVYRILQSQGTIPPGMAPSLVPQVVNQFIGELATAYEAQKMGLTATDEEVSAQIQAMIPGLFENGQFVGSDVYGQYLSQMNTSIPEFEANIRRQILITKLQGVAVNSALITPGEVQAEFKRRTEKAKIDYVKFDAKDIEKQFTPTREEMEAYLKANPMMFQTPAQRDVDMVVADEILLGKGIPVSDQEIQQAYEANRARYTTEGKIRARHILVKTEGKSDAEKAKLKEKAEDLLKQIKGGADFAALAKKNSDDAVSGANGGDLGWFGRGQMVPAFESAAFALKKNEISNVVESEYGYHIIQVTDVEPAKVRPLEEVKDELVTELRRRQLFDKIQDLADKAHAELEKNPGQAQQIASKLGLEYVNADGVEPGGAYGDLGPSGELDSALAGMSENGVSQVIQVAGNKLVVASLRKVTAPHVQDLSAVEKQIKETLTTQKAQQAMTERYAAFQKALLANHNDLEKTAKEFNMKVVTSGDFTRSDNLAGIGPAAYFGDQPFNLPVGQTVSLIASGTPYVFKVVAHSEGDPTKMADMRMQIVAELQQQKTRERRELFEEGLIRKLTDSGVIEIHDDAIKRFIAGMQQS